MVQQDLCDKEVEDWLKTLYSSTLIEEAKGIEEEIQYETVFIEASVKTLSDLIQLADDATVKYDYTNMKYRFNINLRGLAAIHNDLKNLDAMIGMTHMKTCIVNHILYYLQDLHKPESHEVLKDSKSLLVQEDYKHMVLTGPPGVGKTEVARLLGSIFLNMGVLTNNVFKKATRSDLIGGYLGQTALKTTALVQSCIGGVLFIDEAYSLWDPSSEKKDSYAREAIDTLCEAMSYYRANLMVIFAGYPKEIDAFLEANRGMESRFLWRYNIDSYTGVELHAIFCKMVKDVGWEQSVEKKWFVVREKKFTACGRDIEKLLTFVKVEHGRRLFGKKSGRRLLTESDMDSGYEQWLVHQKSDKIVTTNHQFYFV